LHCLPPDWGAGWDNVTVGVTCETQEIADFRLAVLKKCPIKHKIIIHEPILTHIDISAFLEADIEQVIAGGESGEEARPCHYAWILSLKDQCQKANVDFYFKQTGAIFVKDGKTYRIPRSLQHAQAQKAMKSF